MEKRNIIFSEKDARGAAREYFLKNSGIDLEKEKHRRMYAEGAEVLEQGKDGIKIAALVSRYDSEVYQNNRIGINGKVISCEAFSQVPDDNVLGVYLYMITSGECICDEDDRITRRLYADIWGTAYVDAGRDRLEELIRENAEMAFRNERGLKGYISCSFSPGFYGMKLTENAVINKIVGGDEIGISVKENGVMLPLKTCSGIFLVVKDKESLPGTDCMTCVGNPKGCMFCKLRGTIKGD